MMRSLLASLAIALCGLSAGSAAQALTYDPIGVQTNVDDATVFGSWQVLYSSLYSQSGIALGDIYSGANDQIMLAARQVGSDNFALLATIDTSTLTGLHTARNETVEANGAQWYANGLSMGFAGSGSAIFQFDADILSSDGAQRLSWHTNSGAYIGASYAATEIGAGWRAGTAYFAYGGWERFILTEIPDVPMPPALPLFLCSMSMLTMMARRRRG